MESARICCEGHFPPSIKFVARRRAEPNGSNGHIHSKGFLVVEISMQSKYLI